MEIARLIKMRENLYIKLRAEEHKYEYLILKGKVELLDEIIAKELQGIKSVEQDTGQFEKTQITYKLFDTLGLQLECEFPTNINLTFKSAEQIALNTMAIYKIEEAKLAIYCNGNLKMMKTLTL